MEKAVSVYTIGKKDKRISIPEITRAPSLRRGLNRSRKKLQAWAKKHGRPKRLLEP